MRAYARTLTCTVSVLVLQLAALVLHTWFHLVLYTGSCARCGRFLVTVGEMMENSTDFQQRLVLPFYYIAYK